MESKYISVCIREKREQHHTKKANFIKTDKPKKQKQSLTKKDLKYLRNSKERKNGQRTISIQLETNLKIVIIILIVDTLIYIIN